MTEGLTLFSLFMLIYRCAQIYPWRHICKECNHCKRILTRKGEINKVTKKAKCDLNDMTIYFDSTVCEVFYEEHQDVKLQTFNAEVVPLKSRASELRKGA